MLRSDLELIIFDLDGTLIDSKLDLAQAVNAARSHLSLGPIDNELVYSYVGNGAPVLLRRALGPDAGEEEVQTALEYFLRYYGEHNLDYTQLYPGVQEALDRMRDYGAKLQCSRINPSESARPSSTGWAFTITSFACTVETASTRRSPTPWASTS